MRAAWRWLAILVLPATAACGSLIGDWFSEYSFAEDAGGPPATGSLNECTPKFAVSNEITFPSKATLSTLEITTDSTLNTTNDPRCFNDGTAREHCMLLAQEFHLKAKLSATGSKPLVIVTVGDIVIAGELNVSGADGEDSPGPGKHPGSATAFGGGGGSSEEPGGASCAVQGGPSVLRGLVGGGHGGGVDHEDPACRIAGRGGGAVQLVSLCGKIVVQNLIEASGGAGGAAQGGAFHSACPQGAGGGAGGTVWLQAPKIVFDPPNANVYIMGGGGGGGACSPDDTSAWTIGSGGFRKDPGAGGDCTNGISGGDGGTGGADLPVASGDPPALRDAGRGTCGGGGGARGVLVLQEPGRKDCDDVPYWGGCRVIGE